MKCTRLAYLLYAVTIGLLCCGSLPLAAQYPLSSTAKGQGLGSTGVSFSDANSLFYNQAGLVHLPQPAAILSARQPFSLANLKTVAAGFAYPTHSGVFGLSALYYGFEDFNQQQFSIAYARRLFKQLSLGGQVNVLNTRIPEYGSHSILTFELGFHTQLLDGLFLGGHLYNPMQTDINEVEQLPALMRLGLSYIATRQVRFYAEAEKDIDYSATAIFGIEYTLIEPLQLRAGIRNKPSTFHFGLGFRWHNAWLIDLASSYHQTLGFSPSLSIQYLLAPKEAAQ